MWLIDAQAKSITIFYPDAAPQTKRGEDSLEDELLPDLKLTVTQVFQQAGIKHSTQSDNFNDK